jgi:SAM-dependent methyltransferase
MLIWQQLAPCLASTKCLRVSEGATMSDGIYEQAVYYDIAFSFVNVVDQIENLFLPLMEQYSRIPVKSVLDVCCGPSPQLREFARRSYSATGLDLSAPMLEYLKAQGAADGVALELVQGDMRNFTLEAPVDFAYILMGSVGLVGGNAEMLSHLSAMAAAVKPGGLYLLENVFAPLDNLANYKAQSWEMTRDGITVTSTFDRRSASALRQTVLDTLTLDVVDHGTPRRFVERDETKLYFPEEFRTLVELHGGFEFVGYFDRYRPEPLIKASWDHNAVLRRR